MILVYAGLALLIFSFNVTFDNGQILDLLPSFVGYLLLWFALNKKSEINQNFKAAVNYGSVMMFITFLQFFGGCSSLFPTGSIDGTTFAKVFSIIGSVFGIINPLVTAANMIYIAFLCAAFGMYCEDNGKNGFAVVLKILMFMFIALAIFAAVTLFFKNLPIKVWHIGLGLSVVFGIITFISTKNSKEFS